MARKYEMNWVPSRAAWRREHLGRTHVVSCRQLHQQFPGLLDAETKTGSYKAANAWWQLKMAAPYEHQISGLQRQRNGAATLGGGLGARTQLASNELCFTDAEGYFDYLSSRRAAQKIGGHRARDLWATVREAIRWMQSTGRAAQFDLSSLRVNVGAQDVETFTTEEIRILLDNADERMRLYQLLMLNIAGTQKDVSDLHPSELDFDAKRIVRKRSKKSVQNADFVPTVSYLLWDETADLLRKHQSEDSERVLLTSSGSPLVGRGRTDYLGKDWRKYRDRLIKEGLPIRRLPLKAFRKLVASAIANEFGEELAAHFCGHSLRTTLARHYWQKDDDRLDKAIIWVGRQVGTH